MYWFKTCIFISLLKSIENKRVFIDLYYNDKQENYTWKWLNILVMAGVISLIPPTTCSHCACRNWCRNPKDSFSDSSHRWNFFTSTIIFSCTSYGIAYVLACMGLFIMFETFSMNEIAFESIRSNTLCFRALLFSIVCTGAPEWNSHLAFAS